MKSKATWICVQCGYNNRCECTQYSDELEVKTCPPYGCLQGICKPDGSEKEVWELDYHEHQND